MTSSIEVKRPPYPNFESFTVASKSWLTVMEYLCHTWTRICSVCRNPNSICSTFMIYRRVCNKSKRLLEQKLLTFPVQISSSSALSGVRAVKSLVFYVLQIIVCPFVFFLWPLYCVSFDLWLQITPYVSSNFYHHTKLQLSMR